MTQFKVNTVYTNNFICDSDNYFSFKVVKRTEKTVWLENVKYKEAIVRTKIHHYEDKEFCYPMGQYSMAPIISADDNEAV